MAKYTLLSVVLCVIVIFISMPALADDGQVIVAGNNEFAVDLYRVLSTGKGNVFYSPFSISAALAMTYLGARGSTAVEMAKTMHFTLKPEVFHPVFSKIIQEVNNAGKAGNNELVIANQLWGEKSYIFLREFLQAGKEYYRSPLVELDFKGSPEKCAAVINSWVEKATREKIKNLIGPGVINPMTRLVLTNAIYFKGLWDIEFSKDNTSREAFYADGTKKITVDMMHKQAGFKYAKLKDAAMVELPYKGLNLSMIIILPDAKDALESIEKTLTYKELDNELSSMKSCSVKLSLPKFKTTCSYSLKEIFKKMGMEKPFSTSADFSGMDGTENLLITAILHKAFVAVDEKGTEAAAATAVVVGIKGMVREEKVIDFKADHPFMFFIQDNFNGSILFMGRIVNPLTE